MKVNSNPNSKTCLIEIKLLILGNLVIDSLENYWQFIFLRYKRIWTFKQL